MLNLFSKKLSGIRVPHHKNTAGMASERMPVPDQVSIPMSMHIGAPCSPTVKVGDQVCVGQLIGESGAYVSAPIHSSVSGRVAAIDTITYLNGTRVECVTIQTDKLQTVDESIKPPTVSNHGKFIEAIRASGLVGLGGAGFPTHVKFNPKNLNEVDTLIINAAECEPYITSDYRTLMDDAENVLEGAGIIKKYLGIKNIYLAVEDNKPDAIEKLRQMTESDPDFHVVVLKSVYPKGAEKVTIFETTGRTVPTGKLPSDAGVVVSNVTTVAFVARYIKTGMPLIEKTLTVDGSAVKNPKNVIAPIGTRYSDIIAFCGGYQAEPKLVLMGGPMMGTSVFSDSYPLIKNNNALLAFSEEQAYLPPETPCIRCGRCSRACPYNLMPAAIQKCYQAGNVEGLKKYQVNLCIECGCCSFSCPAKRQLVLSNRLAKSMLAQNNSK